MRRMLQNFSRLNRLPFLAIGSLAGWLLISPSASAQPDDFANAQELFGSWGSVTNDNSSASLEAGEPNHGGQGAGNSIWYKWTAPTDGEVSMDTIGSLDPSGAILDTVIGVYVGNNLSSLTQVAANDESFPFTQNNIPDIANVRFGGFSLFPQVFWQGASTLRFNAKAGT